jgi:hypothetical protein
MERKDFGFKEVILFAFILVVFIAATILIFIERVPAFVSFVLYFLSMLGLIGYALILIRRVTLAGNKILDHVKFLEKNLTMEYKNSRQDLAGKIHKDIKTQIVGEVRKSTEKVLNKYRWTTENLYHQVEALHAMYSVLGDFKLPLPPLKSWAINPDFAVILIDHIIKRKPPVILELGSGVSSLIIGLTLARSGSGKLISIEHQEEYYRKTKELLDLHEVSDRVEVVLVPIKDYVLNDIGYKWYDLDDVTLDEGIDLLIVDGPPSTIQKQARFPAYPVLKDEMNTNSHIYLDDADREDEEGIIEEWITEYEELKGEHIRTEKGTFHFIVKK